MLFFFVYVRNLINVREKSMQEFKLITEDNVKIAVNHYKNNFERVIILAPGWFMTKDSKSFREMSEIFSNKADVLSLDFRGHGRSGGFYTFTSKEIYDISAVIQYAQKYYKKIDLIGFSLGAALSLIAGSKYTNINKIIAVSPPVSFEKIENKIWKKEAWLPTIQKCELKRWLSIRPSLKIKKKIKPIEIVDKIICPTLFIAGSKDPTVCCWHTESLFERAACKKKYELFENCYHAEDLFIQNKDKFIKICEDWLFSE